MNSRFNRLVQQLFLGVVVVLFVLAYLMERIGRWYTETPELYLARMVITTIICGLFAYVFGGNGNIIEAFLGGVMGMIFILVAPLHISRYGTAKVMLELLAPFIRRRKSSELRKNRSRYVIDVSQNRLMALLLVCIVGGFAAMVVWFSLPGDNIWFFSGGVLLTLLGSGLFVILVFRELALIILRFLRKGLSVTIKWE